MHRELINYLPGERNVPETIWEKQLQNFPRTLINTIHYIRHIFLSAQGFADV